MAMAAQGPWNLAGAACPKFSSDTKNLYVGKVKQKINLIRTKHVPSISE